jgi:hypothetical protein
MIAPGAIMIVLGVAPAPDIVPPLILAGIGFWLLAWGMK